MPTTFKITGTIARVSKLQTIRDTYRIELVIGEKIEGKGQSHTEYTTVILWNAQAKAASDYLRKGSEVRVFGKVRRTYTKQKGWQSYWNVNWIKYLANFGGPREVQMVLPLSA